MSEPWRPDDVARRIDSLDGGLIAVVGLDISPIGQSDREVSSRQQRLNPDGHECHIGIDDFFDTLGIGHGDRDPLGGDFGLGGLVAQQKRDPLLGERFFKRHGNFGVLDGEEIG